MKDKWIEQTFGGNFLDELMIRPFSVRNWRWITKKWIAFIISVCDELWLIGSGAEVFQTGTGISEGENLWQQIICDTLFKRKESVQNAIKWCESQFDELEKRKYWLREQGFVIKIDRDLKICLAMIELGYIKWHILLSFFPYQNWDLANCIIFICFCFPSHICH